MWTRLTAWLHFLTKKISRASWDTHIIVEKITWSTLSAVICRDTVRTGIWAFRTHSPIDIVIAWNGETPQSHIVQLAKVNSLATIQTDVESVTRQTVVGARLACRAKLVHVVLQPTVLVAFIIGIEIETFDASITFLGWNTVCTSWRTGLSYG